MNVLRPERATARPFEAGVGRRRWPLRRAALALAGVVVAGVALVGVLGADRLDSVRELAAEGRLSEALEQLDRVADGAAPSSSDRFMKGVLLAQMGDLEAAEEIFLELARERPDRPEPLNNLAAIHASRGESEEAMRYLKQALETHPSYQTAFDNLARVSADLASRAYERALGTVPSPGEQAEGVRLTLLTELRQPELPATDTRVADAAPAAPPGDRAPVGRDRGERTAAREPGTTRVEARPAPQPAESEVPSRETAQEADRIAEAVHAWADAWSGQDVDGYLSYYSSRFVPPYGLSRAAWQAQRRARVAQPSYIRVSINFLDVAPASGDRAAVRFVQDYESDSFSDRVVKTLELVREDADWRILEERVEG